MIRSNDTVFHRPSGETWVVCGVDNEKGELIPGGYPFPTLAKLSDCELIEAGDGKQPKEYADALKKEWLDRFIEGRADNDPDNSSCR